MWAASLLVRTKRLVVESPSDIEASILIELQSIANIPFSKYYYELIYSLIHRINVTVVRKKQANKYKKFFLYFYRQ